MNPTIEILLNRRSIRGYVQHPIPEQELNTIIQAAMRSPTAGNMMLYTIIHVQDQEAKETLSRTCDNQPFIAKAPLVLLFLADYQRWFDYFTLSGVEALCLQRGQRMQKPKEADLLLACCDAVIAAQTATIAAESLGIGSCYVGDIMENYEIHQRLFDLPKYVFPICLVCFGYPTPQQAARKLTGRFPRECIVFEDKYRRLARSEFAGMFERAIQQESKPDSGFSNSGQEIYVCKFDADFSKEMRRSVQAIIARWVEE
jgi:nitroreductase